MVSRETPLYLEKLQEYEALVRDFAPRLDLVSAGDLEAFRTRHIADSLRALPHVHHAEPGPAVDVGSGAGLPGIPLAIADPGRHWVLLEPRRRRAAFLEEVVRALELSCQVVSRTAADAARSFGPNFSVATARALAPPVRSLALLAPLVRSGGTMILFVGAGSEVPEGSEEVDEGIAIFRK